jgi:hypothetical protein
VTAEWIEVGAPILVNVFHDDPAVMVAFGMSSGYRDALTTPMAANYNIVPAALLELPDKKPSSRRKRLPGRCCWGSRAAYRGPPMLPRDLLPSRTPVAALWRRLKSACIGGHGAKYIQYRGPIDALLQRINNNSHRIAATGLRLRRPCDWVLRRRVPVS